MAISPHHIASLVRTAREAAGWSRTRLAAECEVSVSTITRLELNEQMPGSVTLLLIAKHLGIDLNAFLVAA